MTLPTGYSVDNAFRLAGFVTGRPVGENPPTGRAVNAGWPLLVSLFDDALLGLLVAEATKFATLPIVAAPSLAFDRALAAMLLETCISARITPLGRLLEVGEQVIGNAQVVFEPGENAVRLMSHNIRRLRSNMVAGVDTETSPTPTPSAGIDAEALNEAIASHAEIEAAHHEKTPTVEPGVKQQAVEDAIEAHRADDDAHHERPDVDGAIAAHAADDDAHHERPDVDGAIAAHAADDDAHHEPPDVDGAIAAHAADDDAHHEPPDVAAAWAAIAAATSGGSW